MDLITVEALVDADAVAWRPGDAYLAGGSWLFSQPQPGVRRLLDLTSFGWPALAATSDGLEIAATCTIAELAAWVGPPSWPAAALFATCADALLGSFKVHQVATVGGNICCALPAGPMTALTVAVDAVATLWQASRASADPGASPASWTVREIPVLDLVVGPGRTALRPGEILRSVHLPATALRARTAVRQVSLTRFGRSAALVIGRVDPDGSTVLAVTASTPRPVSLRWPRLPDVEAALAQLEEAVPFWFDDVHGDPAWRAAMTRQAVADIVGQLGAAS